MSVHTPTKPQREVREAELIDRGHDERLQRIQAVAALMDDAFVIPGTNRRIGLDSLIGLVPGVGDAATACVSAWLVYEARQLGLPKRKIARMLANIGIDTVVGTIPLAGDLFDWAFKANRKNARIVTDHFRRA